MLFVVKIHMIDNQISLKNVSIFQEKKHINLLLSGRGNNTYRSFCKNTTHLQLFECSLFSNASVKNCVIYVVLFGAVFDSNHTL